MQAGEAEMPICTYIRKCRCLKKKVHIYLNAVTAMKAENLRWHMHMQASGYTE